MKMTCIVRIGISAVSMIVAASLGVPSSWAQSAAPRYEVDVTFPKRFPDRWVTGGFGGHCIDAQDHVLLVAPPSSSPPSDITSACSCAGSRSSYAHCSWSSWRALLVSRFT